MNRFIKADEVAEELGISKPYAYKIIRRLNEELREKGMITIAGRVDRTCGGRSAATTSGEAIWLARRVAATGRSRGAAEYQ